MFWNKKAHQVSTDLEANPWFKQALAEAIKCDPVDAVNAAAALYQILSDTVTVKQPHERFCRKHPIPCWACGSIETQLMGTPEHGILLRCINCGDVFKVEGRIIWDRNPPKTWLTSGEVRYAA